MAKYKSPSKLLITAIVAGILLLLGVTVYALSQSQVLEQHASLPTYTTLAIKGNIFIDKNNNGQKDSGEVNYTGTPVANVRVALFSQVCPSTTPTPSVTGQPSVTPPANCHYQTFCPQLGIACREGKPCPTVTCKPTLICITPGVTGGVIQANPGQIEVLQGKSVKAAETGPVGKGTDSQGQDQGKNDVCREIPQRVIDCTVSSDGTYLCSGQNLAPFTSASVTIVKPSAYWKVTSKNPVIVNTNAANVDFGLAPSGIVDGNNGLTEGTKQTFTLHVDGLVSGLPVVMYVSESKNNPNASPLTGVFTTDASGNIALKVTPNDELTIIPVASKGYTTITPNRLEVTVSQNSCGLSTPCIFKATPQ